MGRSGNPDGRPKLLERKPELGKAIVSHIQTGLPVSTAANLEGINTDTIHEWLKRGARDRQGRNGTRTTCYALFSESVEKALAEAETSALNDILNVTNKEGEAIWQARAWYLERCHRAKWGAYNPEKAEAEIRKLKADTVKAEAEADAIRKAVEAREQSVDSVARWGASGPVQTIDAVVVPQPKALETSDSEKNASSASNGASADAGIEQGDHDATAVGEGGDE